MGDVRHQDKLGIFEFNGTRVVMKPVGNGKWELLVTDLNLPEDNSSTITGHFDEIVRLFEQTTRGVFHQAKCLPFTHPLPEKSPFDEQTAFPVKDIEVSTLCFSLRDSMRGYDITVDKDLVIYTKDWPYVRLGEGDPTFLRLRFFNAGSFKVLFDRIVWDNDYPPKFTKNGYDVVHLRSHGNGTIRGHFYLNVPDVTNDSRFLTSSEEVTA